MSAVSIWKQPTRMFCSSRLGNTWIEIIPRLELDNTQVREIVAQGAYDK